MTTEISAALLRSILPPRPVDSHKGSFGHLFAIAGSRGFTGAAKLACEAAGRSGVGLVTLGIPKPLGDAMAASLTETMSVLLPSTDAESVAESALEPALQFAASKNAVVLGPGLSQHPETQAFVLKFVRRCEIPLLVDADGLNALSTKPSTLQEHKAPCVITPHPGEMARLLKLGAATIQENRRDVSVEAARRFNCVVVLKGRRTLIAAPTGDVFVNPTGNNGLAKGGSGDVLSGMIGALMAQGMEAFQAAILGVYAHGLAADIAARDLRPRGMIASDVIRTLPAAWTAIEDL